MSWTEELACELDGLVENLFHTSEIDSTHLCALRLLEQFETEGLPLVATLIIADRQSTGAGRGGRSWDSPKGGLYMSWLGASVEQDLVPSLPMFAAVAAWRAITALVPVEVGIKWPNDLVISGKKVAGLIAHVRHGDKVLSTVGFGLNGEQTPKLETPGPLPPTSLAEFLPEGLPPEWRFTAAVEFVRGLSDALADPAKALEVWREQLIHASGDEMAVRLGSGDVFRGRLIEITAEGHLRLEGDGGERVVTSGDVLE
ncbi:MAG: biotin--[acetyl-CoA-carboxylase] ligase [bacterium]|nr:biotin--[acetyl-CoA-carboxylase] ligase [bacterium]